MTEGGDDSMFPSQRSIRVSTTILLHCTAFHHKEKYYFRNAYTSRDLLH